MKKAERATAQDTFLEAFAQSGIILNGCLSAGINRSTVYDWMEHDETFSLRMNVARAEADERLLREAWRRGSVGVKRVEESTETRDVKVGDAWVPVTVKRHKEITEYSDQLLALLIRGRMPQYRDAAKAGGDVDIQELARKLAEQNGLDPDALLRDAEEAVRGL